MCVLHIEPVVRSILLDFSAIYDIAFANGMQRPKSGDGLALSGQVIRGKIILPLQVSVDYNCFLFFGSFSC